MDDILDRLSAQFWAAKSEGRIELKDTLHRAMFEIERLQHEVETLRTEARNG